MITSNFRACCPHDTLVGVAAVKRECSKQQSRQPEQRKSKVEIATTHETIVVTFLCAGICTKGQGGGGDMDRAAFLTPLIGEPWAWQSRNCWDFACHVERKLFGRELPHIAVPSDQSKRWILESIERHPERSAWREVPDGPGGLVTAADGALVLMAHLRFPAHIGVWLRAEARVIHCSEQHGVCCESVLALRQSGWRRLTFYEPL